MTKLLIVDDNRDVVDLLSEYLSGEGYEVAVSNGGRNALERLEQGERYDVIISDLIMPDIDGFALLSELRDRSDQTPVLVLSGGGVTIKAGDALQVVEGMAAAVLQKPIDYDELLQKITELTASNDAPQAS